MNNLNQRRHLRARDIPYFIQLHLESVTENDSVPHPWKKGHRIYSVEGKPRPMLVIQEMPRKRGKNRYMVYSLTSKKPESGNKDVIRIGNCIDPEKTSFIATEPQVLPENMISRDGEKNSAIRSIGRMEFNNIMSILSRTALTTAANTPKASPSMKE